MIHKLFTTNPPVVLPKVYRIMAVTDPSIIDFLFIGLLCKWVISTGLSIGYNMHLKSGPILIFDKVMVILKLGVRRREKCNGYWIQQKSHSLGIC